MPELTFETFRDFLKSLSRDQVRELQQILLDESYQQRDENNPGLLPEQQS